MKYKPKDTQEVTATLKRDQTLPKESDAKAVSASLKRKSSFTNFTNQLSLTSKNNEKRKSPSTENASNQGISLEKKIQLLNPTTLKKTLGKPPSTNLIVQHHIKKTCNRPPFQGGQQQHSTNNEVMATMATLLD